MILDIEGIVLKKVNYRDDDLILTIFTKDRGNLAVMARGARRNKSKYLSCSQLLVRGQFQLYRGKKYYSINGCDLLDSHYKIREDLIGYSYAMLCAELLSKLLLEEDEHHKIYDMFDKYLRTLIELDDDLLKKILTLSFTVKLISILGYRINHQEYDSKLTPCFFSIAQGSLANERKDMTYDSIGEEIAAFLMKITYIRFEEIAKIYYNKEMVEKITIILLDYIYYHTEISELKSMAFIKEIENMLY